MSLSKKSTVDLWAKNADYSVFLPSISTFYNDFISKQHHSEFVPKDRIPVECENGIEGFNFLNKEQAYYYYPWALYSAGHAQLDIAKSKVQESMIHRRDKKETFILGDSGGFQIGKGVIKFDWDRFFEKKGDADYKGSADGVRDAILNWLEETADYSMILDIPTWAADPVNKERTKLNGFNDALKGTLFNNDYFLKNRKGKTKFLNVLQGGNGVDADIWYDAVKAYPFEGWAMGGQNMRDAYLMLRRLITLRDEKLLDPGRDVIHFLGTSKLEWACLLTAVQRNIRKTVNPGMNVTFDCASPFIATAKGQIYTQHRHENDSFRYVMTKALDSKKFAGSKIPWPWTSPIGDRMTMGDVCYYAPGMLNKIGKEGKTSWDSFSYFLQMGHNVYQHIESVQRANMLADAAALMHQPDPGHWRKVKNGVDEPSSWVPRNTLYMIELVNKVFSSETPMTELDRAQDLLAEFNVKKTLKNTAATFNDLFASSEDQDDQDSWDDLDADDLLKDI
jgi:hypothetical protein